MPGLSPFTREVLRAAWEELFDPSGSFFLPDVLRNGDAARGIPKLDPLHYAGPSPDATVTVDEEVRDSACGRPGADPSPVATSQPVLRIAKARISGLYALRSTPEQLTFSDTNPELTATLYTGQLRGKKQILSVECDAGGGYEFAINCCIPKSDDSRECGGERWTATAKGVFTATVDESTITPTLHVNFPPAGAPPVVTVLKVLVKIAQKDADIRFDVSGLDPDFAELADQAVQTGIAGGAVEKTLQGYLDGAEFKATLGKIITDQLRSALENA